MSQNLKTYLLLFFYALCFAQIWSVCYLEPYFSNDYTCAFGMLFSFVGTYWIQRDFKFQLKLWQKLFFLGLLGLYCTSRIQGDWHLFLFGPYFLSFVFVGFNLFLFKDLSKFRNLILVLVLILTYSAYGYFDGWFKESTGWIDERSILIGGELNEDKSTEKKYEVPDSHLDLSQFTFENSQKQMEKIKTDKPYVFIATWNEDCRPCKRAIRELSPMLDTLQNLETYFVYVSPKNYDFSTFQSSMKEFEQFRNKKVLADHELSLFSATKMQAYPTFLLVNQSTSTIEFMTVGYSPSKKSLFEEKLIEVETK